MSLNTAYSSCTVHTHCLVKCTQSWCKFQRKKQLAGIAALLWFVPRSGRDGGQSSNWCTVMSFLREAGPPPQLSRKCVYLWLYVCVTRQCLAVGVPVLWHKCVGWTSCWLGACWSRWGFWAPCSLSCLAMIYGDKISFLWDDVLRVRLIQQWVRYPQTKYW